MEKTIGKHRLLSLILTEDQLLAIDLAENGFLSEKGWWRSKKFKLAQDLNGNALPWMTYAFIEFLNKRLRDNMRLFEYGSGSSTVYFADKVMQVVTAESKKEWYQSIIDKNLPNVKALFVPNKEDMPYSINSDKNNYDVIIIDGPNREECCNCCINKLAENGVIIIDDTERIPERRIVESLMGEGFKSLDFWGFSPGLIYEKCTTILYKTNNCFNI